MTTAFFTLITVIGLIVAWLQMRSSSPAVPPLEIDQDDPEMVAARQHAKETIADFLSLYRQFPKGAAVKIPFVSSSGVTEFLFAEVDGVREEKLEVRLMTPPVTHTGRLDRFWTVPTTDIVDWVITMPDGKKNGGFTMRVMFKKGREKWGDLPKKLKEEELKYVV
jgi:uncharacterized protein YegJ (DUF2314 family)